jgi:hypothetical protein
MKPTIYLTNPTGLKVGHGGAGKVALITILPPALLLTISSRLVPVGCPPSISMMRRAKAGEMPLADYEAACRGLWGDRARRMPPGKLLSCDAKFWLARQGTPVEEEAVEDGATLLCTCAAGGPCHRRWFAEVLDAAGWRVVLDGAELEDGKAPPLPPPPPPESKTPQLGLFSFSAPSQSLPASPPAPVEPSPSASAGAEPTPAPTPAPAPPPPTAPATASPRPAAATGSSSGSRMRV